MDVGLWIESEDRFEDFSDELYDKFTDFRIYSNDGHHRDAHRIVLAKRTGFFKKLFMEEPLPMEYRFAELNQAGLMVCMEAIYTNLIHVDEEQISEALHALRVMKINCWVRWDPVDDTLSKDPASEEMADPEEGMSTSSSGELPADTESVRRPNAGEADTESVVTTANNGSDANNGDCPTSTFSQSASATSGPSYSTML